MNFGQVHQPNIVLAETALSSHQVSTPNRWVAKCVLPDSPASATREAIYGLFNAVVSRAASVALKREPRKISPTSPKPAPMLP